MRRLALLLALALAAPAAAEEGRMGDVTLLGLARDVAWPRGAQGYDYVLACGFEAGGTLSVHAAPDAASAVLARLDRLTTVEVDTGERRGAWIRVVGADLSFTADGKRRAYTSLLVEGWAEDAYLCAYDEN